MTDDIMARRSYSSADIGRWPRPVEWEKREERSNPDFVFKDGYVFPKAMTCGNYRTPEESRYGYGAHIVAGPVKVFKGEQFVCDYDDRLHQFYPEKWAAARRHLGERPGGYENVGLGKVSLFLSELYGFPVKCRQLLKGCNVSNGYPYYIFISEREQAPDAPHTSTPAS